jgi:tetratricopeptide (TPR) repeat protein
MRTGLWVATIAALTLAALGQVVTHEFVAYDDDIYVEHNPNLRDGPTPEAVWRAFREPYEANWIPLTFVSLQLDHALFGLDPRGYHAVNLALHLAAAIVLFLALRRLTGDEIPAAWVAIVFAVHPLHVESVAWVAERKDTLSGLCFTGALLAYARYAEAPSLRRYAPVLLAGIAALLAKPMAVTLPGVLWLLDVWPLRRRPLSRRTVLEKLPLLAASALVGAIALRTQADAGSWLPAEQFPWPVRLANAALSVAAYLGDAFWPSGLVVFYPHPRDAVSLAGAGAAALAGLALTAGALLALRRRPWLAVGWLWFLGMLVPVLGLLQVGLQARADRYTYLPLVGLSLALAWSVHAWARTPLRRRLALAGAVASALALTAAAHLQARHWRDTETLFGHAVAVSEDNWLAQQWLGVLRLERGDLPAAERHFRAALRGQPEWSEVHLGLADVAAERGDWDEAIRSYRHARSLRPGDAKPRMRLARALAAAGQPERALASARAAVERAEDDATAAAAELILASILLQRHRGDAALAALDRALERDPALAEAHVLRGLALLQADRPAEAEAALARAEALGIDPAAIASARAALSQRSAP